MSQGENRADVEMLLSLCAGGADALAALDHAVRRLHEVEEAKVALARVSPEEVRQAIARRHDLLGEGQGA